jgi:glucose-1-phosphate thymidylyltransferase
MKAVILAAGEGKRLRPFTDTMPKVMLPIANKPILAHVIDAVTKTGIQDIIVIVGYKKERIMEYFTNYTNANLTFIEQNKQLGTAHALFKAKEIITKNKDDEPFLVLAGDNYIDSESIATMIASPDTPAILIKKHQQLSKYGAVTIKDDCVEQLIEKPKNEISPYVSTGIYKFNPSIFSVIEKQIQEGNYALSDTIQLLISQSVKIRSFRANLWLDAVHPWDLIELNETIIQSIPSTTNGIIEKNVTIKGPVYIGKNTRISSGTYIIGPVIIGDDCEIGPYSCIFPSTSIGDHSIIKAFSYIENSVLMEETRIGPQSTIYHSIISRGTSTGNHFSTFAGTAIIPTETHIHHLQHIGAMIGEDCTFHNAITIDPGIIIGGDCTIASMKHITKNISSKTNVM